ncbi:MAG: hypothetical protein AAGK66_08920 [Pseudomonadota bacterium]
MFDPEARRKELDAYEEIYGQYVKERGPFGMISITVGVQSFPIFWEDDPEFDEQTNSEGRRWFKRMICCALHHLVEEQKIRGRT